MHNISFKQFITEGPANKRKIDAEFEQIEQLADLIKKDCAPWLAQKTTVWRGVEPDEIMNTPRWFKKIYNSDEESDENDLMYIGAVRNKRVPRDSDPNHQKILDKFFISKVGIPLRSTSLFCVKSQGIARSYGEAMKIFPIGEFHYAWSKYIPDLFTTMDNAMQKTLIQKLKQVFPEINKKFPKFKKFEDLIFDNNLMFINNGVEAFTYGLSLIPDAFTFDAGLKSVPLTTEIMIVCDKYYIVNASLAEKLKSFGIK